MNIKKIKYLPRSKMVLRLWGIMMLLILIAIAFMWTVQIFLFEQNYISSTIVETESRLAQVIDELQTADLYCDESLTHYASKSVRGKLLLFNQDGTIMLAYVNGHPTSLDELDILNFVQTLQDTPEYSAAMEDGKAWKRTTQHGGNYPSYEIGIPVTWDGEQALLFMNQPMEEVYRVQELNRQHLIILSVILTLSSGIMAWVLSRRFVKPINVIKNAVDSLAQGNLDARPELYLRDELGQLSDSVVQLGQALQKVDILRKEVIANVSHELRAPLSLIAGYGEMVRDVSWNNDIVRNENLNLIIHEAQRMNDMVNDILDYSQLQSGYIQLNKVEYNLCDIIESEVQVCSQSIKNFGITISLDYVEKDIPKEVDVLKISQVMRNLLNNAINHTKDNQVILVSILKNNSKIRVTVSNPGKPIPEEKMKMIWERYYSSQHQGSRRQGTGLGLSIVSAVLDAHGFEYGVFYNNGHNTFWFEV